MTLIGTMQTVVHQWAIRCFGRRHVEDHKVRALRTAEEVVELCQCLDVAKDTLHLLIDSVYSRPTGSLAQEIGGVMLTLGVLAEEYNYNIEECMENEMHRVLGKTPEHFEKRNQEK